MRPDLIDERSLTGLPGWVPVHKDDKRNLYTPEMFLYDPDFENGALLNGPRMAYDDQAPGKQKGLSILRTNFKDLYWDCEFEPGQGWQNMHI